MDKALIVCDMPKGSAFFRQFLSEYGFTHITAVTSQPDARKSMMDAVYDICVVNSPVQGRSAEELACDLAMKNSSQIILFVREEMLDETEARVEDYGIITLSRPVSRQAFGRAVKMSEIAQHRMEIAQREILKLRRKVEDVKLTSRAKCLLIEHRQLTEEEAHHYIEKQAMDSRSTAAEVAEDIIAFYD